jgi:hypothetical protein
MEWLAVQEDGRCCGVSTRSIWTERPRWRASLPECPVTRGALRSNHCSLCVRRVRYTKVGIMHDAFIETLYYVVVADLLCALLRAAAHYEKPRYGGGGSIGAWPVGE